MDTRSSLLLKIRPDIASKTSVGQENFQNKTLRPILKLQNNLLIICFKNYIKKHKNSFYDLSIEKKMKYIENAVQKDNKFKNKIRGMVIGHFTIEEYQLYIQDSSAINKRISRLVIERLQSQIQLFEKKSA